MQLFPSLLFGISASLDALLVGISYGLRKVRIRLWQNLVISLVTLSGACVSVGLHAWLAPLLPGILSRLAGSLILIFLGLYYIMKWLSAFLRGRAGASPARPEASICSGEESSPPGLSLPEVLLLSLTLSVNNIGIGLSASMAGLPFVPAAAATFLCSVLLLLMGNRLGRSRMLGLIGHLADPIAGGLLIGLALLQIFL